MNAECEQILPRISPTLVQCPVKKTDARQCKPRRQCAGNDFDLTHFESLEILSDATVLTPNQYKQLSTDVLESSVTFSQLQHDDTTIITKMNYNYPTSSNIILVVNYNNC